MHCKITLYPFITLIIVRVRRGGCGSLSLITSPRWLGESLSEFDYASWRRLPWCLPFNVTPFVRFILFPPSPSPSRACRPMAVRSDRVAFVSSWRIDSCNIWLSWPLDNPDTHAHTHTAAHVHTQYWSGKVAMKDEIREKWMFLLAILEQHMGHDTHVSVSLKSFYECMVWIFLMNTETCLCECACARW